MIKDILGGGIINCSIPGACDCSKCKCDDPRPGYKEGYSDGYNEQKTKGVPA